MTIMTATRRPVLLLMALVMFAALLPVTSVRAAGQADIAGTGTGGVGATVFYSTPRFITNPATAGAEIVFRKTNSDQGNLLDLGISNCGSAILAQGLQRMVAFSLADVARNTPPGTVPGGLRFCMVSRIAQGNSTIGWTGRLFWD